MKINIEEEDEWNDDSIEFFEIELPKHWILKWLKKIKMKINIEEFEKELLMGLESKTDELYHLANPLHFRSRLIRRGITGYHLDMIVLNYEKNVWKEIRKYHKFVKSFYEPFRIKNENK